MCNISDYINNPSLKPFLIGIGGVSMRSLAETLFAAGCDVAGSDFKESESVEQLRQQGIAVAVGHKAENVQEADYIIRSAAIHEDNPEIMAARQKGIPVFERAQGWGAVMQGYEKALCVAGTHGKTSTTSMLTHIAMAADTDPTVMIGGDLPILGGGHRVGTKKDVILLESCEYCNSFLHFCPTTAVILNVEADHLDFFKDLEDVKSSFRQFALRVPEEDGLVVVNADDEGAVDCTKEIPRKVVTFGIENQADYMAKNIEYHQGTATFQVVKNGELLVKIKLLVPGRHNVLNALACVAAALENGMDVNSIARGLASYTGVGRRFEFKGEYGGAVIYDDYAHHPGEINALFNAVEEMGFDRIIAVFQPHTYTRTHAFFEEFVEQLSRPDLLVLADIFAAREVNTLGISSADLAARIDGSYFIPDFNDIVEFLKKVARPGDCILTIGAGELNQVSGEL
ncbi:MAG: UDP-N-acetylmuramate--L-alanine ligase, partial [Clostridia bacterium]|nr:UDP-N-acetylmuramate--L-alanine ligase [Clostridia bacterium]